jgi:4-hydroxy-3-polyprenylbenzoate decarboxylase
MNSLAEFLEDLDSAGQLRRVSAEVDPQLEIAAITDRVAKAGGPALFFERVRGHRPPVVTNLLGSEARVLRALGVDSYQQIAARVAQWLSPAEPEGWLEKIKPTQTAPGRFPPRVVKSGLCQQVVKPGRDVDLRELPALRHWPLETARWITSGRIFSRDPDTHECLVENAPLLVVDRDRLAVRWHPHHRSLRNLERHAALGQRMSVAVVLGGDPLYAFIGARLPRSIDPLLFGGLLRSKPIELVKCRTSELEVPTDADIVIEGQIDPQEPTVSDSPPSGWNGHYEPVCPLRVVHVAATTQRTNPVFPAVVPGTSVHEMTTIERALGRMLLPVVARAVPELLDYEFPVLAGWPPCAFVAIRKQYAQQARKVAAALWGLEMLMFTKLLVIVDESVDVHDPGQVLAAIGANVYPGRDVFFHQGPGFPLDHAAPEPLAGHQMAIDATAKLPGEHPYPWPARLELDAATAKLIEERWAEYGIPHA